MKFAKFAIYAIYAAAFATLGCSPRIVEVERVRTEYRDRVQVDTTIQRDSIRVTEFVRGDTVRISEYRDRWRYQYKLLRDTVAVHDTTAVETVREVKVEQPLTRWQRWRLAAFPWLLLAAGGFAAWTFRRQLLSLLGRIVTK